MYIRFVTTQMDLDSRQPQGLFVASHALLSCFDLTLDDEKRVRAELNWFNENLPSPDVPYITGRVIFWFKSEAQEYIRRMWGLSYILREHGRLTTVQKCRFLSHVVYRDAYQVAAIPRGRDANRSYK